MLSIPKGLTRASGIDALTHCMEAYVSMYATPFTDGICKEAIKEIFDLKEILNEEELLKNDTFKNIYPNKIQFEELSNLIDECLNVEHEMVIYAMNREEKDRLEAILKEMFDEKMIKELVILKKESDKIKRAKTPEY